MVCVCHSCFLLFASQFSENQVQAYADRVADGERHRAGPYQLSQVVQHVAEGSSPVLG